MMLRLGEPQRQRTLIRIVVGTGSVSDTPGGRRVTGIVLNHANRLSCWLLAALQTFVAAADVAIIVGQT